MSQRPKLRFLLGDRPESQPQEVPVWMRLETDSAGCIVVERTEKGNKFIVRFMLDGTIFRLRQADGIGFQTDEEGRIIDSTPNPELARLREIAELWEWIRPRMRRCMDPTTWYIDGLNPDRRCADFTEIVRAAVNAERKAGGEHGD